MLFFGHIGITLDVILLFCFILNRQPDYRIVILGSMLPDIIDKPLYLLLYGTMPENGRFMGHSIFFVLLLIGISLVIYKKYKYAGFFVLPAAVFLHMLEDQMWNAPRAFLWPFTGLDPHFKINDVLANDSITRRTIEYGATIIQTNYNNHYTYETELIGLLILAMFACYYRLYRLDRLKAFILDGKVSRN